MSVFDQIKCLHDEELYSSVVSLASLVLAVSENSTDVLGSGVKYQVLVYYGTALYEEEEFLKAESVFRKALQLHKAIMKNKMKISKPEMTSEVDVKFKLHKCHVKMKQPTQAITVLESIPAKQRSAKINLALSKLYQNAGMERSAATGYKEILREFPLALDAAVSLMSLGVVGTDVAAMMSPVYSNIASMEWLSSWIRAHSHLASREYQQAITAFKQLDAKTHLRDNIDVLCSLGEAYYLGGQHKQAMVTLQRVHSLDPLSLRDMDLLAAVLAQDKKIKELECLANSLMSLTLHSPEPWTCMAWHCFATKKVTRAVYFAQKAYILDSRNVEALLLKGQALLELKKINEAVQHFREALRVNNYRFESHKGLVECCLANHRTREAITLASNACKHLGQTPRTLTLYASVLAKDAPTVDKAKSCLEKALKQDMLYIDAVCLLAEIYVNEQQVEKAITLLKKQLALESNCRLHQLLGDYLSRNNEHQEALDQYNIALRLDPSNSKALEGVQRTEKHSELGDYAEVDVEEMVESENEVDLQSIGDDGVWSDSEFDGGGQI